MKGIVKGLAIVLIVMIGTCFFVACGEKEPTVYGTVKTNACLFRYVKTETEENEKIENLHRMEMLRTAIEEGEANVQPIRDCKASVQYVKGHKKDKGGLVVSKWLYYYTILGNSLYSKDGLKEYYFYEEKEIELENDAILGKAAEDVDCIEKFCTSFGLYEMKTGECRGKRLYEIADEEWQYVNYDLYYGEGNLKDDPILFAYLLDGGLVVASLARYGEISIEAIEMTVGTLYVGINEQIEPYPVVGYYESEADKIMSTGIDPNPQSEAYQKVYAQLQRPVFYSVSGDIFNQ